MSTYASELAEPADLTEIQQWNREVERRKAERNARRGR